MDWFSHYTLAFGLGRKLKLTKSKMKALLICSLIPDIDFLLVLFGTSAFFKYHKGITHSVFTGLLLALVVALLFYITTKENVMGAALIGIASHLVLDLVMMGKSVTRYVGNSAEIAYEKGVAWFWPFSSYRFDLAQVLPGWLASALFIAVLLFSICVLVHFWKKKDYPWSPWK